MNILLTGYSGNLGPEIAARLTGHRLYALARNPEAAPSMDHVSLVRGTLTTVPDHLEIEAVIHSAALTAFRAPLAELRETNVTGTAALLKTAERWPKLQRFIHLSTTCVAGNRTGLIPEQPISPAPAFINAYEQSKWEAEELVLRSHLPGEIVRLPIVAGSEQDGSVRRPGALHHMLYWLYQGLVPMLPGAPDSRVDLISTEQAARAVTGLLEQPVQPGRIFNTTAGTAAPGLSELLAHLQTQFRKNHSGWARESIAPPEVVDAATFALFEESVRVSGDVLFRKVCDDGRSFLPGLLHPRTFESSLSFLPPPTDWRLLTERIFTWLLRHDWGRPAKTRYAA